MIKAISKISAMWILIVSLGCNQDNKKKPMQITLPDTALTNRIDHGYVYSNQLRRELNLKDLRIGVDSFEFRIYEEFSLGTPDRLFIIKNENYKWKCSLYHYWTIRLEKESPMRIEEMISNTFATVVHSRTLFLCVAGINLLTP